MVFVLLHPLPDDHEQGKVNLWKDGGNDTELSCSRNKLWLILRGSIITFEVLDNHEILAENEDEECWGDYRTGETEDHPYAEVDDGPNIVFRQE